MFCNICAKTTEVNQILMTIVPLGLSFLAFLFEKLSKKKDGESDLGKYSKTTRIILLILQVGGVIWATVAIVKNDSDNKGEKDALKLKNKTDSTLLAHRWIFDTTRLKEIIESTDTLSLKSKENLEQTNKTIRSSSVLLSKLEDIAFPLEPMKIYMEYRFIIKRSEFYRFCPSLGKMFRESGNYRSDSINTSWGILPDSIPNLDAETINFLWGTQCNITLYRDSIFKRTKIEINPVHFHIIMNNMQESIDIKNMQPTIGLRFSRETVEVSASKNANVMVVGALGYNITGVKKMLGWYLNFNWLKRNVDSLKIRQIVISTGQIPHARYSFFFDPEKTNNSNFISFKRRIKEGDLFAEKGL